MSDFYLMHSHVCISLCTHVLLFLHLVVVVYEDELTDSFMQCLVQLNHSELKEPAVTYIALEKRYATGTIVWDFEKWALML